MAVGMNSSQMHAAASCIVNALKALAHLPDELPLIAPAVLDSVAGLKRTLALKSTQASLDVEESLIALSVSAASNPAASLALGHLENLYGCEMHMSHLPAPGDAAGLRKLGVNVTSDPCFASRDLFME